MSYKMLTFEFLRQNLFRMEANAENATSKWNLYLSLALIFFVLVFVAPLLLFINVRTTLAADVFIKNLTIRTDRIAKEQKRSERLVTKLLPTVVIGNQNRRFLTLF